MPAIGDKVPDTIVMITTADGPGPASSAELLGSGTVVLIGVPGAFTPVCSDVHLPGFVLAAGQLKEKGVDRVAVVSVNDAFVMGAWGRSEDAGAEFLMIADPDAAFATAMGMATDASSFGLGTRSERYAAILQDGVIVSFEVERSFVEHEVSSVDAVLARL
jgi:glutaredoxin/glutathione-dependent peroxiredoxin